MKRKPSDSAYLGGEWPRFTQDAAPMPPARSWRTGWRVALILAAIAFLILGVASYMAMLWHHAGGGR